MEDSFESSVLIDDNQSGSFVISGNIKVLTTNGRASFYLKKLNAIVSDGRILIRYDDDNKEKILNNLQVRLSRLGIRATLSDDIRILEEGFVRNKESFLGFSERARKIRDNTFKDDAELLGEFEHFVKAIENVVVGRKLYPLQLLSAYHMAFAQNSCNFSVPGAGKTTIVYAAYAYLKLVEDVNKHVDKILIIGPTAAFGPWEDEYKECFGREPSIVKISEQSHDVRERHFYSKESSEITVIGYQLLDRYQQDIKYFLRHNRVMLVVDEAHYVKSVNGVWSGALLSFSNDAVARVALTGTPAPNGYEDLYNLYRFILPLNYEQVLGMNYKRLRDLAGDKKHPERVEDFSKRVSPFFVRIKKKDLKLPRVINHEPIKVKMSPTQRKIYDFIEGEYIRGFQNSSVGNLKQKLSQARIIRLRQAATNPALLSRPLDDYYLDSGYTDGLGINDEDILHRIKCYEKNEIPPKFIALLELARRILSKDGEKVIIWSQFIYNSKQIRKMLVDDGIPSELLIGEVEKASRREVIKKFNNPEDMSFRVVIAHPKAVGESISLHKGCHNAIYLDMDYNAASYIQSRDRIHRVLNPLPSGAVTNYYRIVSEDSIDGVITEKVNEKVEVMEKLINEDIPLFVSNGLNDESDDVNIVKALIDDYSRRNSK